MGSNKKDFIELTVSLHMIVFPRGRTTSRCSYCGIHSLLSAMGAPPRILEPYCPTVLKRIIAKRNLYSNVDSLNKRNYGSKCEYYEEKYIPIGGRGILRSMAHANENLKSTISHISQERCLKMDTIPLSSFLQKIVKDIGVPNWKYPRNLESPRVSSPGIGNDSGMMGSRTDPNAQIGTVTGEIYREVILEQHVCLVWCAMGAEFVLMDDNPRPHHANHQKRTPSIRGYHPYRLVSILTIFKSSRIRMGHAWLTSCSL
ncbi:nibrin [Trichonephila clavipes]|nr:nibrin [Trichonephila clavipes]